MSDEADTLIWRTSTWSQSGNCVEVAVHQAGVLIRNSRDREGPTVGFTFTEWHAFLAGVKAGEFDGAEPNGFPVTD